MFILTAKINRKKVLTLIASVLVIVLALVLILVAIRAGAQASTGQGSIKTNEDRVAYLNSLGWVVDEEPIETQEVVIPREFTGVYADYLNLQKKQGYPLEDYGGMAAVRYSYSVLNYRSGEKNIVADIIVFGQSVIAGDIQSTAIDGFMTALKSSDRAI